uniref:DNA-directed RNA polymerases I and III subunit RPAC1 n=1 Tax=Syphacia muris TaxID=451379 RepID=A0A0N5A7V8_9BILA
MVLKFHILLFNYFLFLFSHFRILTLPTIPDRDIKYIVAKRYQYTCTDNNARFDNLLYIENDEIRMSPPTLYLSVIIPAMNEEKRLPVMLHDCLQYLSERSLEDNDFTFEVIIVDDGSTDNTAKQALYFGRRYDDKNTIKVLKLDCNQGKAKMVYNCFLNIFAVLGGAVRNGVLCSRGKLILFADADGATDFKDFEKLENELIKLTTAEHVLPKKKNSFDWTFPAIAVGSRDISNKTMDVKRSLIRNFLMMGFHLLVQLFIAPRVQDTQCGFKLFTRPSAAKLFRFLHVERWAFDTELMVLARMLHYPICEVPVNWHEVDGSKIVPFFTWIEMARDIVIIWYHYFTGKWKRGQKVEPESLDLKDRLVMEPERVINTYDCDTDIGPKNYEKWDIKKYCSRITLKVVNESPDGMSLEFDLINVEAPIANTLRRVLLAEVPSMAIEKLYLYQNTSIIQDEVLCHRLGLLPIKADPREFEMPLTKVVGINESGVDCDEEPPGDPKRNVIFEINVSCKKNPKCPKTATDPKELYENAVVYSNAFKWVPIGDQSKDLLMQPAMVYDDILVAKLRPGQEIEAKCHCVKGIGRDHAKFSPVATASYRLLPEITLLRQFTGEEAEIVKNSFSDGVIGIKPDGTAYVKDARMDTCSRNIFRFENLAKDIVLSRKKNHFIFSVESTGALKSNELVVEACKIMEEKCKALKKLFKAQVQKITGN